MRPLVTISWLCLFFAAFSQNPTFTAQEFKLLGVKQISNHLIICSEGDRKEIHLTALESNGELAWELNVDAVHVEPGYHFNKLQMHGDDSLLFIVQESSENILLQEILCQTGELVDEYTLATNTLQENKLWTIHKSKLTLIEPQTNYLLVSALQKDGLISEVLTSPVLNDINYKKLTPAFSYGKNIYSTSHSLDANHGGMHLYVQRCNIQTGDTLQRDVYLELKATSFTYNSTIDRGVYGVFPAQEGFYVVGKLDMYMKRAYPKNKSDESFLGIWIAKFDKNLNLVFFDEVPFQRLNGIMTKEALFKATVVDLVEDGTNGVFVTINERKEALYGQKIFLYYTAQGKLQLAKQARDEYHFFEYDRNGLRTAGKKNRARVINDDWHSIAGGAYLYLRPIQELFSKQTNSVIAMSNAARPTLDSKAFQYFNFDKQTIYLHYFDKKGGTLKVFAE